MSSNKITLNDAMETLQSMFPDFDKKLLKEMLYKTNGHMERTIEHLLTMQDAQMRGASYGGGGGGGNITPTSATTNNRSTAAFPPVPISPTSPVTYGGRSSSSSVVRHTLSDSFLNYDYEEQTNQQMYNNSRMASSNHSQQQQDEAYARELQRMMILEQSGMTPKGAFSNAQRRNPTTGQPQHTQPATRDPMKGFGVNNRPPPASGWSDKARRKLADFKSKFSRTSGNAAAKRARDNHDLLDDDDDL